ncbi:hypothetical protein BV898_02722 [Hypsibius exemplaris]|uniref:Uncharacterized protein n=1 Tax=Hypsibius exemplaris TaxID=2072580 RepID=A0A1W0X7B7_HYPEX|nr:hypothetical protein BV898_02722 [Hypsibius exemplaris]
MKQYFSITTTSQVVMVVVCSLILNLSQAYPTQTQQLDKTSHRSKRTLVSSVADNNDADDSAKLIGGQRSDDYRVGGGLENAAQLSYYNSNINNNQPLVSDFEGPSSYAADYYTAMLADPYRHYAGTPYQSIIKSASAKREDPDSKGQFRLRFGRSGVRLRFGRSDPPTLRFG